jgi:hypothetical protein
MVRLPQRYPLVAGALVAGAQVAGEAGVAA